MKKLHLLVVEWPLISAIGTTVAHERKTACTIKIISSVLTPAKRNENYFTASATHKIGGCWRLRYENKTHLTNSNVRDMTFTTRTPLNQPKNGLSNRKLLSTKPR